MECPECGFKGVLDNEKFCGKCGANILLDKHKKKIKEKIRIFGTIRNSKNRNPVKAASIKLSIEGTEIASVSSNEEGEYEYTADEDCTGQTLDFIIQKEGFIKKNISYEIDRSEIKSDILIDEIEIKIKGKICDKADRPLADASISFRIGDKTIKLISDKDGSFSFTAGQQFLNQSIGYEASKEGLKVKSGKLELIEDLKCINLDPISVPFWNKNKVAVVLIALIVLSIVAFAIPSVIDILQDILQDESPELAIDPDPLNFNFRPDTRPQTFSIWNEGEENLEWEVSTDRDWITVTPANGTEARTLTVSINSADLRPGSYTGSITVTSNGGNETGIISFLYMDIEEPTIEGLIIIHYFMADPAVIPAKGTSILRWEVSGAARVTIDGIGIVDPAGEIVVDPDETTIYILRATNDAKKDVKTVTVNVGVEPVELPIIHYFTADPYIISAGEEFTLRWDVSGAISVTINGIEVDLVGEKDVDPDETTIYILRATNEAGISNVKTVTVNVETVTVNVEELPPELSVYPDILNFGTISVGDEKSLIFEISNDGGGTLKWEVGDKPDWIEISPTYGYSGTVTVTANTAGLKAGNLYGGEIEINSNGSKVFIPVTLRIEELPPKLSVDPDPPSFDFKLGTYLNIKGANTRTFSVDNSGGGNLYWRIYAKEDWITIEPSSGVNFETVTLKIITTGLKPGDYKGKIYIESKYGTSEGDIFLSFVDNTPIIRQTISKYVVE